MFPLHSSIINISIVIVLEANIIKDGEQNIGRNVSGSNPNSSTCFHVTQFISTGPFVRITS